MIHKIIIVFVLLVLTDQIIAQDTITKASTTQDPLFNNPGESLSDRWLVGKEIKNKYFQIVPYQPVYLLPFAVTDQINDMPTSNNPLNSVAVPSGFQNSELKFQLSFKARAVRFKIKGIGISLWAAYTQSSRWQFYNGVLSRPFRETNYEPEGIILFETPYKLFGGLKGVLAGVGFNHQSNGRANPFSRSWNRIIFQFGWEHENWSIVARPWIRLEEDAIEDNNPDIEDYVGRIELLTAFSKNRWNLSLASRHSLRFGDDNRGSLRLNTSFRIAGNLSLMTEVFHGYGESLIDYNYKQTYLGIGISLLEWR